MRGPIDYIVVAFENKEFDGTILKSLETPLNDGIIKLIALSVISKNNDGEVSYLDLSELSQDGDYLFEFIDKYSPDVKGIDSEDIEEVGDIIDNNVTAGLLVIEQVWAKPLKQALIDANAVLLAEGRIHPEASKELED